MNHQSAGDAPLVRRLMSLGYEAVLLAALLVTAALPFVLAARNADPIAARAVFQCFLVAVSGLYFGWQWLHGGQTLPMKTWRLRLVTAAGRPLTRAHALKRLLFALAGTAACGAGFVWALVDPDHRFLHDRLAGTKIVKDESKRTNEVLSQAAGSRRP